MSRKQAGLVVLVASLVAGWSGVAFAQTPPPPERMRPTEDRTNASAHSPSAPNPPSSPQEAFERDRAAMKAQLRKAMDKADDEIRALEKLEASDPDDKKKRDQAEQKRLKDLESRLSDDMTKLEKATVDDWTKARPAIQYNLDAMKAESARAEGMLGTSAPSK